MAERPALAEVRRERFGKQWRVCQRCGGEAVKWRGVWCKRCEETTQGDVLFALVYEDSSAIHSLHVDARAAMCALREDTRDGGITCLVMRKVVGQAGARAFLVERGDGMQQMQEDRDLQRDVEYSEGYAPHFGRS